jgi:hypothetical protein
MSQASKGRSKDGLLLEAYCMRKYHHRSSLINQQSSQISFTHTEE